MPVSWLKDLPADLRNAVLVHPSAGGREFYRLAFLGDSIIEVYLRKRLFWDYPEDDVGNLAKKRSVLASTSALAFLARQWGLDRELIYQDGEDPSDYALASLAEAFVAALALGLGREKAKRFLDEEFWPHAGEILERFADYKSLVREILLNRHQRFRYKLLGQAGPAHSPKYTVCLEIEGKEVTRGEGRSIKEAEQAASELFLERMGY